MCIHIVEIMLISSDYEAYNACLEVSTTWSELLTSESYLEKAKYVFHDEVVDDESKLWRAAKEGNVEEVQRLSNHIFVNVNSVTWNHTPLCEAVKNVNPHAPGNHMYIIQLLLEKGAKPNRADCTGWTPLHYAAKHGSQDITCILLEGGADPDLANNHGWTALHIAALCVNRDVMQLLLDRGANPNGADQNGITPLHWAARTDNKDVVKFLLNRGAKPNRADYLDGYTPLHYAASRGHQDVVQLLLKAGARPNNIDKLGKSPQLLAQQNGHINIAYILNEALKEQLDQGNTTW